MIRFFSILFLVYSFSAHAITDFRGKNIVLSKQPTRLVALIPNLAETVDAFGKADILVGIPDFTVLSNSNNLKPKNLGPYNRLSAEAVLSLNPDLVLASIDGNDSAFVEKLEELKVPVLVFDTSSLDSIEKTMRLMAELFHEKPPLKIQTLLNTLESFKKHPLKKEQSIFVQIGWNPIISISGKTFVGELVEKLGFKNITSDSIVKYPHTNAEEVLRRDPDQIVICQLTNNPTETEKSVEFWKQFKKLKAVQKNHIHVINGDILLKPGVSLLEGIEFLDRIKKQ